jgi:hypothetical protein
MYRVYVDESGDRGMRPESSEYFVVAALIVKDECDAALRRELATIRAELHRSPDTLLHFRKMGHPAKVKVTRDLGSSGNVAAITSVIICKRHLDRAPFISTADPMYLFALRMLWERISWYVRDHGNRKAKVTFAQIRHFKIDKINAYRTRLERMETHMHWPSFEGHPFTMRGVEEVELLQLADSVASAVAAAIEPNNFGDVEDRYLRNLAPKSYRYRNSPLSTYGLRVFPPAVAQQGGMLHHLNNY